MSHSNPKAMCSVCKTFLDPEKNGEAICPNCGAVYYPDKEIIEYEEEAFSSSHSDEFPEITGTGGGNAGILSATDEQDGSITDQLYKSAKTKPNQGEGAERWD